MTMRATRYVIALLAACLCVSGCDRVDELLGDAPSKIKRAPGERIDVMLGATGVQADAGVADQPIEIPEQTTGDTWPNHNDAMRATPHLGLSGFAHSQSSSIGDGNTFSRSSVPTPVIAGGLVFAMDARGIVSAHDEKNIDSIRWTNSDGTPARVYDVQGGGIAYDGGVIYATTGYGNLRAIDAATGVMKWNVTLGAPVRGAPAVGAGIVAVLTADNQTLAFDTTNGQPRWNHRGIREAAGFYSTTAPVFSDGIIVAAYSSGEVFALRAETGSVLWNDTLGATGRTRADAIFNGIDADPIVQDGVVVVTSTAGEMQASALLNGRPLWQAKIGSHRTPWSAGNALFVLSDSHDIAALFKRSGAVRWATSLARHEARDPNKDTTLQLYGPILAGNAIMIVDHDGKLMTFKPEDGTALDSYKLARNIACTPVMANGALYAVTQDAELVKYY